MDYGIAVYSRDVALKLDSLPSGVRSRLRDALTVLTERLYALVEAAEPDKTGKLRRETAFGVTERGTRLSGRVYFPRGLPAAEYGKAAALEYGAHGTAQVKAHASRLDHIFGRQMAPLNVMVAAYSRTLNITADRFLRGPMAELAPEVIAEFKAALDAATAEAA